MLRINLIQNQHPLLPEMLLIFVFPSQLRGTDRHEVPFSFKSGEVCFTRTHEIIAKKSLPFRNKVTR
jgi:hypothetical protein